MNTSDFKALLDLHQTYLKTKGKKGERLELNRETIVGDPDDFTFRHSDLSQALLERVNFHNMNLNGANCERAIIQHCEFANCQMSTSSFNHALIEGTMFVQCRIATTFFQTTTLFDNGFTHSWLNRSDFSNASIEQCAYKHSDLPGVNFTNVKFRETTFDLCDLAKTKWNNATILWNNHEVLSEILLRAAGDHLKRRQIAGLIIVSKDKCWDHFLEIDHPEKDWALKTLAKFIQPNDCHPKTLDDYK